MFPRRRSGRSPRGTHDGEPPWQQEGREFAPPFWTGERSPPPAFLERAWQSPSPSFPVQRRRERPGRVSSPSGHRQEGDSFRRDHFLVAPSEPSMMRSWRVELPERRGEYRREEFYGAEPGFRERGWPAPSEAPMVRRRGVASPEHDRDFNRKRPRFLEPSAHLSTQCPMERRGGDDFGLSSRFLAQSPMEWSPPRYDERGREMHRELGGARTSEGATPGRRWEFLESDWPSPSELRMVRPCFGVASPDLHREYHSARPLDFSRQHPIHHGNGFGMPPRGYLDLSRRSPMEHGRERSPPRILEGRSRRPWTPPPRDCERRWEGLCPERPPRCIEVTPPGTRGRFTLQGPHSWRERTQGSPALSAGLITGRLLHAGDRSSASTFDQRERGGAGGGGGGCGGGTLPRRFVREKRGIRKAVHESSGSGRQRSQRQGIAADPVKSALVEEKPETQAKIDEASIVGTCGDTQKGFFRLTGPADPSKIRPKAVLVEALKLLQASDRDYNFKTDQLKSIRQDLAVQNIEDEISVQVYEFHARLVLSNGDISELNVCLTKLQQHYQKKLNDHSAEFVAYDILLSAIQGKNIEVMSKLGRLPSSLKQEEAVKHAQTVTQSMRSGNYVQFFKLYKTAPNLNGQLMSLYFERMRFGALKCMAKAYTQNIPVIYISKILGFHGTQETVAWLQRHGAVTCSGEHGEAFLPKESAPTLAIPDDDVGVSKRTQSIEKFPPDLSC